MHRSGSSGTMPGMREIGLRGGGAGSFESPQRCGGGVWVGDSRDRPVQHVVFVVLCVSDIEMRRMIIYKQCLFHGAHSQLRVRITYGIHAHAPACISNLEHVFSPVFQDPQNRPQHS